MGIEADSAISRPKLHSAERKNDLSHIVQFMIRFCVKLLREGASP